MPNSPFGNTKLSILLFFDGQNLLIKDGPEQETQMLDIAVFPVIPNHKFNDPEVPEFVERSSAVAGNGQCPSAPSSSII